MATSTLTQLLNYDGNTLQESRLYTHNPSALWNWQKRDEFLAEIWNSIQFEHGGQEIGAYSKETATVWKKSEENIKKQEKVLDVW